MKDSELIIILSLLVGAVMVPGYLIFSSGTRVYPRIFGVYLLAILYGPCLPFGAHRPMLPAWAYDVIALSLPVCAFFLFYRRRPWLVAVFLAVNLTIVLVIAYAVVLGMYFRNPGWETDLRGVPLSQVTTSLLVVGDIRYFLLLDAACLTWYALLKIWRKMRAGD